MKKNIFISVFFSFMFFLSACSKPVPEGGVVFEQTMTKEVATLAPAQTKTVSPTLSPTETPTATTPPFISLSEGEDYFVYSTIKNPPELEYYLFLPELGQKYKIFSDRKIYSYSLNTNNQLAFVTDCEDGHAIYLDKFPFTGNNLQKIVGDTNTFYDLLSWSDDGKYLALVQLQHQLFQIMIWDGENLIPVYTFQNQINDAIWSKDNRLAFVVHQFDCENCDHGEVYVWDGDRTLNVSNNAESEDGFPAWSNDGQLAYQSESENEYSIFVWDGKSLINDLPNRYKIETGDSIHLWYTSIPSWTDKNQLLFESTSLENQDSDHIMENLFM
jgi:WD40 repeat protein